MELKTLLVAALVYFGLCQHALAEGPSFSNIDTTGMSHISHCPKGATENTACENGVGYCSSLGKPLRKCRRLKCMPVPLSGSTSYTFGYPATFAGISAVEPLYIIIYSRTLADVTVSAPLLNYSVSVAVNGSAVIQLPSSLRTDDLDNTYPLGFHINASNPIDVYIEDPFYSAQEGTAVIPEESLGTEYVVASWHESGSYSGIAVVATADGTQVTIKLSNGEVINVQLNQYELHFVTRQMEITGTFVSATDKVAVYGGSECTYIVGPNCDYLIEQMPALESLSKMYIASYPYNRYKFSLRVTAIYNSTYVEITGGLTATIDRGDYLTYSFQSQAVAVVSTEIVMVTAYAQGMETEPEGGNDHDPAFAVMPGLDRYRPAYGFSVPDHALGATLMVIIPEDFVSSLVFNGGAFVPVDTTQVYVPGMGNYTVLYISPPYGSNTISGQTAFGATLSLFYDQGETWLVLPWLY